MKKEDYRFKFLYVIGIIAVVCGHSGKGISLLYDWFPPYSFQVALFLFCSGYFYRDASIEHISKYIFHKIKTLILPLYLYNLFYGLFVTATHWGGFSVGGKLSLSTLIYEPIIHGHQFYYNLGGWFVIPLFMVEIFNIVIRKIMKILRIEISEYLYFAIGLFIGLAGMYLGMTEYEYKWLFLMRFLCSIPFFCMGRIYKMKIEKFDSKVSNTIYFPFIFLVQLAIIYINNGTVTYSLSGCNNFPKYKILTYISTYTIIIFWLRVANILLPIIENNKIINLLSSNTYSIMINHYFAFWIINFVYAVISKYTGFLEAFSIEEWKANVGYFYTPRNMSQFYIIYNVAGILIPILMQEGINKLKNGLMSFRVDTK